MTPDLMEAGSERLNLPIFVLLINKGKHRTH